jgi:hypothetical protein
MSIQSSPASLLRSILLTATLFFLSSGAAQAESTGAVITEPDIAIPDNGDLSEEARVHRRGKRKRKGKRVVVVRRGSNDRKRHRSHRRRAHNRPTLVVHHSAPNPRVGYRQHSNPVVVRSSGPQVNRQKRSSGWLHAGGGFGSVAGAKRDGKTEGAGRGVFGGGGQIRAFYGGGEVALTSSPSEPLDITAAGFVGAALPVPVLQPMIGVRAGAGQHMSEGQLSPHIVVGPQFGFVARKPGQRLGLRVMVDLGFDYGIQERRISPELFMTFSAVF